MTRVDIEKDLVKSFKGHWGTKTQLAAYLGCDRKSTKIEQATKGLLRIGHDYAARDLSERLYEMQR